MAQASGFSGKRCFITGAASGIGRATALKLAADGAELYLTDRDAEGLDKTVADARALGAQVPEHRALDISDYDEVAAFAADIHTRHPAMDVVMNIAGVSAWGTVDQLTHQHWRSMVDINLMGPIHVIESFLPPMVAAGRGGCNRFRSPGWIATTRACRSGPPASVGMRSRRSMWPTGSWPACERTGSSSTRHPTSARCTCSSGRRGGRTALR
jgi:NAD(P)-dependent dehydrogenase (short-subunit alcohol dehydrogenase family)